MTSWRSPRLATSSAIAGVTQQGAQRRSGIVKVVDRLEQRHDVEGAEISIGVRVDPHQPDLLEERHDFKHVADGLGHRDHVVGDRACPESAMRVGGATRNTSSSPVITSE